VLVLGLETSTTRSSVALVDTDRVVASASLGVARDTASSSPRHRVLPRAGRHRGRPHPRGRGRHRSGTVHRARVGLATAQSFAAARHLPVVGLSGLDVLAFRARYTRRAICAVIDARRGELFWAFYRTCAGRGAARDGPGRGPHRAADGGDRGPRRRGPGARRRRADRAPAAAGHRARRSRVRTWPGPTPPTWRSWRSPVRPRGDDPARRAAADLPAGGRRQIGWQQHDGPAAVRR
jgi:hypothetical protein